MKLIKSFTALLLAVLLVCTLSVSAFAYNDVAIDDENIQAIEFIDRLGIVPSSWNGDFNPDQNFSRADAIVSIYRLLYGRDIDAADYESVQFDFEVNGDEGDVAEGSVINYYLAWAQDNYLITSKTENAKFNPASAITGNEFLTLLAKVLRLPDTAEGNELDYPDDYAGEVSGVVENIEAGDNPVTRKEAAIAFAAAINSVDGEAGEAGVYKDFDGKPLDSLAVNVFHMSDVELVIRATTNKKLGYEVKNGVLLSNGADIDLGSDLSEFVGYGITITYRDDDNSGTYTEDETVLTYTVSSTKTVTVPTSGLSIPSGNTISVNVESASFNITTSTYLYLNDEPWPLNDPNYDLVRSVSAIGRVTSITNRPNLQFKCMQAGDDIMFATVFAYESKPGKIVGINNGIYSVYDYYCAGTDNDIKQFSVNDCDFTNTVKVGDYVNFYESGGKCHFTPGTNITSSVDSFGINTTTGLLNCTIAGGNVLNVHAFFKFGSVILNPSTSADAEKYVFILENSGSNYLLTWELPMSNHTELRITNIASNSANSTHTIDAIDLKTGKAINFSVKYDNVDSPKALKVNDVVNYSDNGAEGDARVVYVKKSADKTLDVIDMGTYFKDTASDKIYYKNQFYFGNLGTGGDFTSGVATLNLDMANTVVSIVY